MKVWRPAFLSHRLQVSFFCEKLSLVYGCDCGNSSYIHISQLTDSNDLSALRTNDNTSHHWGPLIWRGLIKDSCKTLVKSTSWRRKHNHYFISTSPSHHLQYKAFFFDCFFHLIPNLCRSHNVRVATNPNFYLISYNFCVRFY